MGFKNKIKILGGKEYKVILKNPNNLNENEVKPVLGSWQDMQQVSIDKNGEAVEFDGEFYCENELDNTGKTILLEVKGKYYQLLQKYSFSDLESNNYLAKFKHVCYRAKAYGSED